MPAAGQQGFLIQQFRVRSWPSSRFKWQQILFFQAKTDHGDADHTDDNDVVDDDEYYDHCW